VCLEGKVEFAFTINHCNQSTDSSIVLAGVDRRYLGRSLRIKNKAIHSLRPLFESRTRNRHAHLAASSLCGLNFNRSNSDFLEILDKELVTPHSALHSFRIPAQSIRTAHPACIVLSQSLVTVWNDAFTLCLPHALARNKVCSTPGRKFAWGGDVAWEVRCGAIRSRMHRKQGNRSLKI
jgi:hypothetical protein